MDAQITIGDPSSNDPVSTVGGYQLALGEGTLLIEMSEAENGSLGLSWSNNNGEDETLPDATEITLLFDVVGMGGDASPLTFVGDPENAVGSYTATPPAYNFQDGSMGLKLGRAASHYPFGEAEIIAEAGDAYEDGGATASDAEDDDAVLTQQIVVVNNVDVTQLGDYQVTYNVTDSWGRQANEVSRTVSVRDTTKPIIALNGIIDRESCRG